MGRARSTGTKMNACRVLVRKPHVVGWIILKWMLER
jgi:hypothetical protein